MLREEKSDKTKEFDKKKRNQQEQNNCWLVKTEDGRWREVDSPKKAVHMLQTYLKTINIPKDREVIVAGGRGVRKKEDFQTLRLLADKLHGTVGVSRSLVDAGWFPKEMQMGMNGRKINPGLYVAIGISGAFQHQIALKDAEYVLVINQDKKAPLFDRADFGIAGDYRDVLPLWLKMIDE